MARKKLNDQLTKALTGKITEPTKTQIESGNFANLLYDYSSSFDHTDSKKWALEYLEKVDITLKKQLEKVNSKNFKNLGFVCRLITKGCVIPYTQEDILSRLSNINQTEQIESQVKPKPKAVEKKNLVLYKIDSEMDQIISGRDVAKRFHCTGTRKELSEAVEYVNKQLTDIKENAEYYNKTIAKNLEKFFNTILQSLDSAIPKRKVTKVKKTKEVDFTSKINYLKQDVKNGIVSMDIEKVIGATIVYLFDTKYEQMIKIESKVGETLSIKGCTIINNNPEKTVKRKLSKNVKDIIGTKSIINLNRNFDQLKTTVKKSHSRISKDMIIVSVK